MTLPDAIGDSVSKLHAYYYKDESLMVIKYLIYSFAYVISHPAIEEKIENKFKILGKYWPFLLIVIRMIIIYNFEELEVLGLT